jgi:hypothetical protein
MILRTAAARPFCRPRWVANVATKSPDYSELYSRASAPETKDFTIGLRRQMHENPELMYQEHATSALVQSTLDKLEVPYTKGWGINTRPERSYFYRKHISAISLVQCLFLRFFFVPYWLPILLASRSRLYHSSRLLAGTTALAARAWLPRLEMGRRPVCCSALTWMRFLS